MIDFSESIKHRNDPQKASSTALLRVADAFTSFRLLTSLTSDFASDITTKSLVTAWRKLIVFSRLENRSQKVFAVSLLLEKSIINSSCIFPATSDSGEKAKPQ